MGRDGSVRVQRMANDIDGTNCASLGTWDHGRESHPLPMATPRLQPLRAEDHPGTTPNLACKAKVRRSAALGRGRGKVH